MEHGYIRDMLDVKVLILFAMARVETAVTAQQIYELCYQDECVSYFDVMQAIPQMVATGHLCQLENGTYEITPKGREDGTVTENSVVYSLAQRVLAAIERFNREEHRRHYVKSEILTQDSGLYVRLQLDDQVGNLMDLKLMAPSAAQAKKIQIAFQNNAEAFYQTITEILLEDTDDAQ